MVPRASLAIGWHQMIWTMNWTWDFQTAWKVILVFNFNYKKKYGKATFNFKMLTSILLSAHSKFRNIYYFQVAQCSWSHSAWDLLGHLSQRLASSWRILLTWLLACGSWPVWEALFFQPSTTTTSSNVFILLAGLCLLLVSICDLILLWNFIKIVDF